MTELQREQDLMRRIGWRLMPFLVLIFLVAFIDRQNVGFAKLQMLGDLGISEAAYGFGASLFFIGYVVFEVPCALVLQRYGAKIAFASIIFLWGLVTFLLAFTSTVTMFCVLRFLLGVAQAGFYPGAIFFISTWFPRSYRIRMLGFFSLGSALGNTTGGLVNGSLLDLGGTWGLAGWQWVFIGGGIPAILLAVATLIYLPSWPETARFLNTEERKLLAAAHAREPAEVTAHGNPLSVLWDRRVLALSALYVLLATAFYAVTYWLPTIIRGFGVTATVNGILYSVPWAISAVLVVLLPRIFRDDRRAFHVIAGLSFAGVIAFAASIHLTGNSSRFVALALGGPCIAALNPFFWSIASRIFSGAQAAVAIATINSIGNIGGFVAQNLVPWVDEYAKSAGGAMLVPIGCLGLMGAAALGAAIAGRGRAAQRA